MDTEYVRQVVIDSLLQFGADSTEPIWETLLISDGRPLGRQFEFCSIRAIWYWDQNTVEFFDKNSMFLGEITLREPALAASSCRTTATDTFQGAEAFHERALPKKSLVPLRLLLVDDEPRIADKQAILLERAGFEVQVAYDGPHAVAAASAFDPDVFILDLGMPDVDGFKLAGQLRSAMNCERKVFIALSGYSDQKHLDQASNSGFDEYLVKPCNLGVLVEILSDVSRQAVHEYANTASCSKLDTPYAHWSNSGGDGRI